MPATEAAGTESRKPCTSSGADACASLTLNTVGDWNSRTCTSFIAVGSIASDSPPLSLRKAVENDCAVIECEVADCEIMGCGVLDCEVTDCAVVDCAVTDGANFGFFIFLGFVTSSSSGSLNRTRLSEAGFAADGTGSEELTSSVDTHLSGALLAFAF